MGFGFSVPENSKYQMPDNQNGSRSRSTFNWKSHYNFLKSFIQRRIKFQSNK